MVAVCVAPGRLARICLEGREHGVLCKRIAEASPVGCAPGFSAGDAAMPEKNENQPVARPSGLVGLTGPGADAVKASTRHLAHGAATRPLRSSFKEWVVKLHHLGFNDHVAELRPSMGKI